ncbi:MAG: tRNA pseudouridine(38-40) synthase TruA [Chloroflexi bacterium HGW-Chloroflexi-2]|jgi:tRNA pseudouridine38-40 synthase|nr:MAG: tRNA pseudouridine(38-40) synthase TruA [Chloroflexi bacterium HGW-Chloroflexi-2]
MARYQVKIAYDGSEFFGFQRQGETRTVQLEIENALRVIGWVGQSITAAGRTDTGVHASGQVIAFDFEWKHSEETLKNALNANLPEDVAVHAVKVANEVFHPRFEAISRCYHYRIYCQPTRNPLRDRYAWRVWPSVSLQDLQLAAKELIGTHNFAAFGLPPKKGGNTIRTIYEADWSSYQEDFLFRVKANAFLYHMVRKIVFLQVKIAQGVWTVDQLREGIYHQVDQLPGLAIPNGLELVQVQYQNKNFDE